jgi:hypothetical protein
MIGQAVVLDLVMAMLPERQQALFDKPGRSKDEARESACEMYFGEEFLAA